MGASPSGTRTRKNSRTQSDINYEEETRRPAARADKKPRQDGDMIKKFIDETGNHYGRLIVLGYAGKDHHRNHIWLCQCDCGNKTIVTGSALRRGNTRSCGCLHRESSQARITALNYVHGLHGTKTYQAWKNMKQRCGNSHRPDFKHYGGRGITVCDRWLHSYENFLKDMGECPPRLTLDRINPNGNYEPSNCRWATWKTQVHNRRQNEIKNTIACSICRGVDAHLPSCVWAR